MAATDFKRLPGFRDFVPEEMGVRSAIFDAWRRVSRRYGFLEYDGPPLEPLDLYVEKSGEEIVGQLYAFTDKGGRDVSLRPEMTPSLARILGERSRSMSKPIRWFSIPQLFRYERQQRGRLREHYQWNADIVGEDAIGADVEVLAVAIDGLRELGLGHQDFQAKVSDRRLLSAVLDAVGVQEDQRPGVFATIDKATRAPREAIESMLLERVGLGRTRSDAILTLLDSPDLETVRQLYADRDDVGPAIERLDEYARKLGAMGLADFLRFDLTIVRGLAYYTGIVFELFDAQGELRAICGGGRYDRLLELVGGEPLPAVGFGMGDVVLADLLSGRELTPAVDLGVDYYLVTIGDEASDLALRVGARLRSTGHSVLVPHRSRSVRKQFAAAAGAGARRAVVLGPDEAARGVAVVRDMGSGEERDVPLAELGVEGSNG